MGARDTGGAQGGAASHSGHHRHSYTRDWSSQQNLPLCGESQREDHEIGHGHVGEDCVCRPRPVAEQEWRHVVAEENDMGQSPNSHLQKEDGFQSHLPGGS